MNLTEVLKALYASEINCGIESFYDGGWSAWIGDTLNGRAMEEHELKTMDDIAKWLSDAAVKRYPKSLYAINLSTERPQ